jgi:hypothetical protein
MDSGSDLGRVATPGNTFRARAEARQRQFRASGGTPPGEWGHWLADEDAKAGRNFATERAFRAASARDAAGKGVGERTFVNMLSSQALCFNVFAPLADDLALASEVLRSVLPRLDRVASIRFEFTPPADVFGDQTAQGGVDCDLRIDGASTDGFPMVVTLETKFVEPGFSTCAFRDLKRLKPREGETCRPYCPDALDHPATECLYRKLKSYRYWDQCVRLGTLGSIPERGCPFQGGEWQLWVNHVLAHALAERDGARPLFVVCAPEANEKLLADDILEGFQSRLTDPSSFQFLRLDDLLGAVRSSVKGRSPALRAWSAALDARYGGFEK